MGNFCSGQRSGGTSLLAGKDDRYGGFIIDPDALPQDASTFLRNLRHSLLHWKSQGKKGIWLKVMIKNVDFVPLAVKEDFRYHHAEEDYIMLTKWLGELPSTLPANASHQVGIGAIVMNAKNQILVVQEITGPTKGTGVWKMPTGVVIQGENIIDAAVREVKEETHVDVEFVELLGIRQAHNVAFGKSDIFCLCLLRPMSLDMPSDMPSDIPSDIPITKQESEIADAQWMSLEAFRSQKFNSESTFLTRVADIATACLEEGYHGCAPELLAFGYRKKGSYFYHNTKDIYKYLEKKKSKI